MPKEFSRAGIKTCNAAALSHSPLSSQALVRSFRTLLDDVSPTIQ